MFHCLSTSQTGNILESDDLVDIGTHNINLRAAGPHRDPGTRRSLLKHGSVSDRVGSSAALGQIGRRLRRGAGAVLSLCEPALHSRRSFVLCYHQPRISPAYRAPVAGFDSNWERMFKVTTDISGAGICSDPRSNGSVYLAMPRTGRIDRSRMNYATRCWTGRTGLLCE